MQPLIDLYNKYLEFAWSSFMFDMDVYANVWMYIPLLIPIFFYSLFFLIKWTFLLIPIYMPFLMVLRFIQNIFLTYSHA